MKTREDNKIVKLEFLELSNYPLWAYLKKKINTFTFDAWPFMLLHIWFTPSEGPKDFVNRFFKKSDCGFWTIKSDHGKRPSSMVRFHGPWCKPALILS